jgi:hypothetical protein
MSADVYHKLRGACCTWMLVLFAYHGYSQRNDSPVKLEHYALDSFTSGTVKLKNGTGSQHLLNYNLVTKEMIFKQGDVFLAIAEPETTDTVFIGKRKFVWSGDAKKGFYEWLAGREHPMFVEYTCTVKEPGTPVGFGTSNTTAATATKSLIHQGGAYALKLPDGYEVIPKRTLLVRFDNEYYKIKNEQQLARLFPSKRDIINSWTKEHKTNFLKDEEVALLMEQLQ